MWWKVIRTFDSWLATLMTIIFNTQNNYWFLKWLQTLLKKKKLIQTPTAHQLVIVTTDYNKPFISCAANWKMPLGFPSHSKKKRQNIWSTWPLLMKAPQVVMYMWTYLLSELLDWLWSFSTPLSLSATKPWGSSWLSDILSDSLHDRIWRFSNVHSTSNKAQNAGDAM